MANNEGFEVRDELSLDGEKFQIQYVEEPFEVDGIWYDPSSAPIHQASPMIEIKCLGCYKGCGCTKTAKLTTEGIIEHNNAAQPMGRRPQRRRREQ